MSTGHQWKNFGPQNGEIRRLAGWKSFERESLPFLINLDELLTGCSLSLPNEPPQ